MRVRVHRTHRTSPHSSIRTLHTSATRAGTSACPCTCPRAHPFARRSSSRTGHGRTARPDGSAQQPLAVAWCATAASTAVTARRSESQGGTHRWGCRRRRCRARSSGSGSGRGWGSGSGRGSSSSLGGRSNCCCRRSCSSVATAKTPLVRNATGRLLRFAAVADDFVEPRQLLQRRQLLLHEAVSAAAHPLYATCFLARRAALEGRPRGRSGSPLRPRRRPRALTRRRSPCRSTLATPAGLCFWPPGPRRCWRCSVLRHRGRVVDAASDTPAYCREVTQTCTVAARGEASELRRKRERVLRQDPGVL